MENCYDPPPATHIARIRVESLNKCHYWTVDDLFQENWIEEKANHYFHPIP